MGQRQRLRGPLHPLAHGGVAAPAAVSWTGGGAAHSAADTLNIRPQASSAASLLYITPPTFTLHPSPLVERVTHHRYACSTRDQQQCCSVRARFTSFSTPFHISLRLLPSPLRAVCSAHPHLQSSASVS